MSAGMDVPADGTAQAMAAVAGAGADRWRRTTWWIFAHQQGILPVVAVPPLTLLAMAAIALAVAVVATALPGESAARSAPATILRSE